LIALEKEEKSFRTLKERAHLRPRTISAKLQTCSDWNYFAIWEEIEQRILNYDFADAVRGRSGQDSTMKLVTADLNLYG
jgi:hypothetical protein